MNFHRSLQISLAGILLVLGSLAGCSHSRTDVQIANEVQGKIYADPNVPSRKIAVQSNNGVVTLSGIVDSETERTAAANDATQVDGVKTVVNNLQVFSAAAAGPSEPYSAPHKKSSASGSTGGLASPTVAIPEGTRLSIRMIDSIDSEKNKPGDVFRATLESPIEVDDQVVVPKDADVEGRVVAVKSAGHFTGRSDLGLELTKLIVNGRSYQLHTEEYVRQGSSRGKRTAETVGGGAAVGAIIGAVAGGGKGAAIGAATGAGAGTAVQAVTKGQQIRVPSEAVLEFQLRAPVRVSPTATNRNRRKLE